MKNRNIALDCIRVLACILVILAHCPMPNIGTSGFIMASCTLFGQICIPLFFILSGYLLLPTKETMFPFMRRRLKRVVGPTLFWTAVYLLVAYFTYGSYAGQPWGKTLLSIPFSRQGCGFLWFMYTLIGLYVLAPILSAWLEKASKKELLFILVLWGVSLCYPMLRPFVYLTEDTFGILYYFSGFAGYFLLGYYIKKYQPNLSYLMLAVLCLIPILVAFGSRIGEVDFLAGSFIFLSIWYAMMSLSLFLLILKVVKKERGGAGTFLSKVVISLSNCSFGIYLIHRLVMMNGLFKLGFISAYGGIAQILITIPLTLFISWLIVWLLSFIPGAEYIIGYSNRVTNTNTKMNNK